MSEVVLAVESVDIDLGSRRVVHAATYACRAGSIVAVVGANGAGKTSLLRAMTGLLSPAEGRVLYRGTPILSLAVAERARHIAYLPQQPEIHWPLDVASVVALGRMPLGARLGHLAASDKKAIAQAMHAMDVTHLADRPATALSGGERARVLFARALAQESPVIIADEPAAGLDAGHQLSLFAGMTEVVNGGRCVIVALHDLTLAARFCHETVLLDGGRIVASGATPKVLASPLLDRAFGVRMLRGSLDGVQVVTPGGPID